MKLEYSSDARDVVNYYCPNGYTLSNHGHSSEGNHSKEEMIIPSLGKLGDGGSLYYRPVFACLKFPIVQSEVF